MAIFRKKSKKNSLGTNLRQMQLIMRSAVFRLALIMFLLIVPVCILTMIMSGRAIRMAENQVSGDIQEALNLNMNQLDLYLQNLSRRLYTVSRENEDYVRLMKKTGDSSEVASMHTYLRLNGVFADILSEYMWADNVIASFPDAGFFVSGKTTMNQSDKEMFLNEMEQFDQEKSQRGWFVSGNNPALLMGVFSYRNTFYGASFRLDHLLEMIQLDTSSNIAVFARAGEGILSDRPELTDVPVFSGDPNVTVNGKRYIVLSAESSFSNLVLIDLVSRAMLDQMLPGYMRILFIISIIFLLCIPLLFLAFSKWLVKPVNILIDAIHSVDDGNLDYRISQKTGTYEFDLLNRNFNEMMDSVKDLKINVYEKELERQDIRLQYLSQQIQPHFILNAMNIIYSYEPEEYDLIQKMVLCLSRYFQFIVNANRPYVRVKDEMDHISNYLEIQKIRYGDRISSCVVQTEQNAEDAVMPPLMIQNLVENVIKYALRDDASIDVLITAHVEDKHVEILIRDTGCGISDEILDLIRRFQETKVRQEGLGTGIQNTIERLELFFGEEARFEIGRWKMDEGTQIRLVFPMKYPQDQEG